MSHGHITGDWGLELFREAAHWKAYLAHLLRPHIRGRVLEVGAGIGGTTQALCPSAAADGVQSWICLEPDHKQANRISTMIAAGSLPGICDAVNGQLAGFKPEDPFDTILYIDVLEHIEDDSTEVANAASLLCEGGRLVVLSPAHQALFSRLDEVAGHHRRYSLAALVALTPPPLRPVQSRYLDSVGMFASYANRLLLRQGMPTSAQLALWDRIMVPLSRWLDPLFRYRLGKSVLVVWEKRG